MSNNNKISTPTPKMDTSISKSRGPFIGPPQAKNIANEYLRDKLCPLRYYEVSHTPVLWKYAYRPIDFSFVVDNFGVQYVGEDNKHHLIDSLKEDFAISEDWTWGLYYEINLKWDYNNLTLDISMREYIRKICKSTSICNPTNLNMPPTLPPLVNMGWHPKNQCPTTRLPPQPKTKPQISNKFSGASCSTCKHYTEPFSWPFPSSLANKWRQQKQHSKSQMKC